jgi:hypothetical protein
MRIPTAKSPMKLAWRRLSSRRRNASGTSTLIKSVIHTRPDSAHAGGFVSSDVRSWYIAATTLGISPFTMIK